MLGTNPYPFTRLVDGIIEWVSKTGERVVMQSGNTPVSSDKIEIFPFIEHEKIKELILEADIVISQGGFGSLQDCMEVNARTIAVPRMIEFGESIDDQTEIVNALAEENRAIPLYDVSELEHAIEMALNMKTEKHNTSKMPEHVAMTISEILGN